MRQAHFAPHRNISLLPSPCLPRGESREIPLFPELWPYLEECFDLAAPGTEYVITRYRDTNANLSQPIAAKHYLQVTDDHFSKAVRNPVQQPAVLPRTGSQATVAE